MCRVHSKILSESDPPRCPEGHPAYTWHVVDTDKRAIIHPAPRRGETLEIKEIPRLPRLHCEKCLADQDVVMRYLDIKSNRKHKVCSVCGSPFPLRKKKTSRNFGKKSRRGSKREDALFSLQQTGDIRDLRFDNDAPRPKYDLEVYGTRAVGKLLSTLEGRAEFESLASEVRRSLTYVTSYTPTATYFEKSGRFVVEHAGPRTAHDRLKHKLFSAVVGVQVSSPE